jgi:hypothetical protein
MAVLTGLYGLFMGTGPFAKSVPLKEINKGIPLFVGVMAAAWASYTYLWTWLAVILLIVSTLVLFAFFEEFLMYLDIRSKERWFFSAFTILMVIALWVSFQADSRAIKEARARMEAETRAVASINKQKTYWQPDRNVTEAVSGNVLAYLAAVDYVPVDWEYEKQLERKGRAQRKIPVTVVLLNNSFEDVKLKALSGWDFSVCDEFWLWRVHLTRKGSNTVIREWNREVPETDILLSPMQKAEFSFDWDGRDRIGRIMPPGEYSLHLTTALKQPDHKSIKIMRQITIDNAGPEIVYVPDPHMERFRQQERWDMIFKDMQRTIEMNWRIQRMFQQP